MKSRFIHYFPIITMMAVAIVLPSEAFCVTGQDTPIEVGHVGWGRDLDAALQQSRQTGKPVFLFFQEVPGCIGCRTFGSEVLTTPLLVKAIEDEFIPVLVYNNRMGGNDEELLRRFGEPSWNFQVIRFLDADGRDIIPRKDKVWTLEGVAARMIETLRAIGRSVPLYLQNLARMTASHPATGSSPRQ